MKTSTCVLPLVMALGSLHAQNAQQIANSLPTPELKNFERSTAIPIPKVDGAKISVFCTDYEQLTRDNKFTHRLSDTPIHVAYKVEKGGETAISGDHRFVVTGAKATGNDKPDTIPALLQWKGGEGSYKLGKEVAICAPDASPELQAVIAKDFKSVLGSKVSFVPSAQGADIELQVQKAKAGDQERYKLNITPKGIKATAYSAKGLFYATRSLLQIARQNSGGIPCGEADDLPRYDVRGFMLDVGRTPFTLKDLHLVIDTMAWYKMNDLHLHLNDNYIFHEHYVKDGRDPFKESYAAFRLESKIKGKDGTPLTAKDLFYTKQEFIDLVKYARLRGITIVPEFDAPAHALSFTRVRPDLIYKGKMPHHPDRRCEALDAANPAALSFMKTVFDEYLKPAPGLKQAVFADCPVVHVGADEFFGDNEGYRSFADGILKHVLKSGHKARIWGSLSKKPGNTPVVSKGVQVNVWSQGWMKPWEAVNQGYDIINTNDGDLYIVPFANYYRMDRNLAKLYNDWKPNRIGDAVLPAGHPKLLGATFAIWNDECDLRHSGYGLYDIWEMIAAPAAIIAQKTWGLQEMPMDFETHRKLVGAIGNAPGCNPYYLWKKNSPFSLNINTLPQSIGKPDLGPNYRLSMELEMSQETAGKEQVLLSGPSGTLFAAMKDGTVGFRRADTMEFSFAYKLPVGKKVRFELIGKPEETSLLIDGQTVGTLTLMNYRNPEESYQPRTRGLRSTFILPLKTLGESFQGKVYNFSITPSAPSKEEEIVTLGEAPTTIPD